MNHKYNYYKPIKYIKDIINSRYNILVILVISSFTIITFKLISLQIVHKDYYLKSISYYTEKLVDGSSTPRGRIYDRNGNIIVDNIAIKTIYYKKQKGITISEEIQLAYKVSKMISLDYENLRTLNLKEFWLLLHEDKGNEKITVAEKKQLKERKITTKEIYELKINRITDDELSLLSEEDKKAAYLYFLMNKGYSYNEKIIKKNNVSDLEYALISENFGALKGFNTKLEWERTYPHGEVLKSLLGKVSNESQGIPVELKDYYLKKGYTLNDRVGISYLEQQYEEILKGQKATYRVLSDNSLELLKEGSRGKDITLTIDINLQQAVEQALSEEIINAKGEANTEYYNRSFVIINDPKTGEILAIAGKQIVVVNNEKKIIDYTPGVTTSPVTVGSVIKGASMTVGYQKKVVDINSYLLDECIKIKSTPKKCSYRTLGNINDITALAYSSNVYQFKIAIAVGGGNYSYNGPLKLNEDAFDIYRNTYLEYGLGKKTNIDLPVESIGFKGTSKVAGHLLDFSIGQYDTYTPIQLLQYIGTIANYGTVMQLHLLKSIYEPTNPALTIKVMDYENKELHKVNLEEKYMHRIREGFKAVMDWGYGVGYMGNIPNSAGKTGTSQSFIDTDNDGNIDTETTTNTFAGFYPFDDPKMAMVIVSPDVSHPNGISNYRTNVNKRIAARVSNIFFDIFN